MPWTGCCAEARSDRVGETYSQDVARAGGIVLAKMFVQARRLGLMGSNGKQGTGGQRERHTSKVSIQFGLAIR